MTASSTTRTTSVTSFSLASIMSALPDPESLSDAIGTSASLDSPSASAREPDSSASISASVGSLSASALAPGFQRSASRTSNASCLDRRSAEAM